MRESARNRLSAVLTGEFFADNASTFSLHNDHFLSAFAVRASRILTFCELSVAGFLYILNGTSFKARGFRLSMAVSVSRLAQLGNRATLLI